MLTSHQFALLVVLARHAGRVMSRDAIMDLLRHEPHEAFDRSIDVHISRIRAVIEDDPKKPRRVITVRGAGYVFAEGAGVRRVKRLYQKIYLTILASLLVVVLVAGASGASARRLRRLRSRSRWPANLPAPSCRRRILPRAPAAGARTAGATARCRSCAVRPRAGADRGGRPAAAVAAPARSGRLVLRRRPHLEPVAARRAIADGASAFAAPASGVWPHSIPRQHRADRRAVRLSGRTRTDPAARTTAGGRRDARCRQFRRTRTVEGRDEVARLAESFNRAAGRIEQLVGAHRMLLANASHELRTPLSRIRLGLELYGSTAMRTTRRRSSATSPSSTC